MEEKSTQMEAKGKKTTEGRRRKLQGNFRKTKAGERARSTRKRRDTCLDSEQKRLWAWM